ncbi:MAG: hypothetical protein Q7T21_07495 [Gallionella sp.]|nr:hypothetical protein [Gallionella sp.]
MVSPKCRIILLIVLATALLLSGCANVSGLKAFTSDGCSLFPDGTLPDRTHWCDCCFNHDLAYWCGGGEVERKTADKALHACVLERTGNNALAETMYEGVRLGGSPVLPTWYRWGYGWKYGRGYQPLTEEEQQQAAAMLNNYKLTHPSGYCRKQ